MKNILAAFILVLVAVSPCAPAADSMLIQEFDFAAARDNPVRLASDYLNERASGNPLFGLLTSALHLLTRDLSRQLGYSEHERENQVRRLARVVHAVRLRDPVTARREMERLVEGSAEYLGRRSPDLMDQKVRWTQAFEA